ncbi:hypothetical protein ACHAWF_004497 [Thalassiosira exigua]
MGEATDGASERSDVPNERVRRRVVEDLDFFGARYPSDFYSVFFSCVDRWNAEPDGIAEGGGWVGCTSTCAREARRHA